MAVTWRSTAAISAGVGTGSAALKLAAGVSAGRILLVYVAFGNDDNTPVTVDDPDLVELGQAFAGSGSSGADTGPRGIAVFAKITDATDANKVINVTNPGTGGSGRVTRAYAIMFDYTEEAVFFDVASDGVDADNTSWSFSGIDLEGHAGGHVAMFEATSPDSPAPTPGSYSLTWPGAVSAGAALGSRNTGTTAKGDDVRGSSQSRDLGGDNTGTLSYSLSWASAVRGPIIFVSMWDGPAETPAVEEYYYDGTTEHLITEYYYDGTTEHPVTLELA